MNITIADRCFKFLNSWLTRPYSPNLTNADKILANLKHIGQIDREEWAKSFDIICKALALFDLTLVYELAIENIRLNKEGHLIIDTSFTMLNLDEEPLYASFFLDKSLNLLEEATEKNITSKVELDLPLYVCEIDIEADEPDNEQYIENVPPQIHPNITANLSNASLSKSYRSLPFFPQLEEVTAKTTSSVNNNLLEQSTRPSTPGLALE